MARPGGSIGIGWYTIKIQKRASVTPEVKTVQMEFDGSNGKQMTRHTPMLDVTNLIDEFRESVRHLWNGHFRTRSTSGKSDNQSPVPNWQLLDDFKQARNALFRAIVLDGICKDDCRESELGERMDYLVVQIVDDVTVPILVNRSPTENHGYWDFPVNHVSANDIDMRLVDFFDFDSYGFVNLEYLLIQISASVVHPEIVGRFALIKAAHTRTFFDRKFYEKQS